MVTKLQRRRKFDLNATIPPNLSVIWRNGHLVTCFAVHDKRSLKGPNEMTIKTPARVLFVCLGNICRSPTAEAVFRRRAQQQGLSNIHIDSAGTGNWHIGKPPDTRAIAAGRARGYELQHLRARKVTQQDFEQFTHILAMDTQNLEYLQQMEQKNGGAKARLFLRFGIANRVDVPNPYFGGSDGFEQVLDLIETACDGLITALKNP
jgi:protein-tyrosine phosphatase